MASSAGQTHQLVTHYVENRDSANWAIFMGKIIMSPPSPLSALCTADETAVAIEAGLRVESFLNAKGSGRSKPSAAAECFESSSSRETF
jgi:hypothetical protein